MLIYLPVAEMTVPADAIFLLGTFVGFLSGVFGVGGGFLTTPFLIFMGLPPAMAVGTQANQLVAISLNGVMNHWRRGNVDVRLGGIMLCGSFIGTFIGVGIFSLMQYIGQIDLFIPILYILLLGSMGSLMLTESVSAIFKRKTGEPTAKLAHSPFITGLPYKMRFPRSKLYISVFVPAGIGLIGGILTSTLGVGGGFILVPAMIYLLGMPTLLVAGTALFQTLITSIFATMLHSVTSHSVDLVLACLLIAGGVIGAQVGVRAARRLKGVYARVLLALMLLAVAFHLAGQLLIRPAEIYSTVIG